MKDLIIKIKRKKELQGLADSVISEKLKNHLERNNIDLQETSEKEKKIIIKDIRSQLRLLVGRFQTGIKNKKFLLQTRQLNKLLKTHTSTAERLDFYPEFKQLLKKLNTKSILDLGCGLNPIALATPEIKYYASDINIDDLEILKEFFKQNEIKGEVFVLDLQNLPKKLPKTDVCLLLKVLDIIDPKHKITEPLLKQIPSKKIIASFSTKKLSGKRMNVPKRFWFENLLKRINYSFKKLEIENEIFYVIDKP